MISFCCTPFETLEKPCGLKILSKKFILTGEFFVFMHLYNRRINKGGAFVNDNSERIRNVMERAECIRRRNDDKIISRLKFASVTCACMLICCICAFPEHYASGTVSKHCASIMLIDGVGGYVLTAILAFAAATVITAVCIKRRK